MRRAKGVIRDDNIVGKQEHFSRNDCSPRASSTRQQSRPFDTNVKGCTNGAGS